MPFYVEPKNEYPELKNKKSVLIIPCRFCPAASLAVKEKEPYLKLFAWFLKTPAFERYLSFLKQKLTHNDIKSKILKSRMPHQFVLCMWTEKRRAKLKKLAAKFDAMLVVGCEGAVETIKDSLSGTDCEVVQAVSTCGLMNVYPRFNLPCDISLDLVKLTPVHFTGE